MWMMLLHLHVNLNADDEGSYMFFRHIHLPGLSEDVLTFSQAEFKYLLRDPANVNAMKQTCTIVIYACY